jgi:glutamate transport system permease protein
MTISLLFDAPGPRARRRHRIYALLGIVLVGMTAAVVWRKMAEARQLEGYMWRPFLSTEIWTEYLIPGLIGTLLAAGAGLALALIFGLLFGLGRLSRISFVRWACGAVVEFFRAIPVLIMIVFAFGLYVQHAVFPADRVPFAAVVTALMLYNGAVIAELVRSGVTSVPAGQREAGLAIGLTETQTLRAVLLPQAITAMLPALLSQFVIALKDSALGTAITYTELLSWAKTAGSAYANTIPVYIVAGVMFIAVNYLMTKVAESAASRLRRAGFRPRNSP